MIWTLLTLASDNEQAEGLQVVVSPTISSGVLQLKTFCRSGEERFQGLAFAYRQVTKSQTLTVTQHELHCHPPFGYTSRVHIVFVGNEYTVNILGTKFMSGMVQSDADVYNLHTSCVQDQTGIIMKSTITK